MAPLNVAFVMDPLEAVQPDADTSFALMLASAGRGHAVFHVDPGTIGYADGHCVASTRRALVSAEAGLAPGHLEAPVFQPLDTMDAIWVRTDPPFDVPYLHVTQLLALAEARGSLVLNSTRGLQAANEHLFALNFPDLGPESLVSADAVALMAFQDQVGGAMVLKPIDGHGGEGVVVLRSGDPNGPALIELLTHGGTEPVLAQRYLEAVSEGDKRVLLLDGEVLGAVNRVPRGIDHRGNLHVGAVAVADTLDDHERALCARLAEPLRSLGLYFVGIDLIGGVLTEVNVTSPTGIQEMERFDGEPYADRVARWVETKVRG